MIRQRFQIIYDKCSVSWYRHCPTDGAHRKQCTTIKPKSLRINYFNYGNGRVATVFAASRKIPLQKLKCRAHVLQFTHPFYNYAALSMAQESYLNFIYRNVFILQNTKMHVAVNARASEEISFNSWALYLPILFINYTSNIQKIFTFRL